MRHYALDPAGGANGAPQTSWLDFVFVERKEGERAVGKGGKRKGEGEKGK